jgi:hypothetical protein
LSENIRECYRHAENCRREAKEQRDPVFRQDFLDCERRWLLLAPRLCAGRAHGEAHPTLA